MSELTIQQEKLLASVPASFEFDLDGVGSITVEPRVSKAGNVFYIGELSDDNGKKAIASFDGEPQAVLSALPTWQVGTSGEIITLKQGEVHLTEPRKYGKTHRLAGQVMPGTGGKWSRTDSGRVGVTVEGVEKQYMALATVAQVLHKTERTHEGYLIKCTLTPPPSGRSTPAAGSSTGFALVAKQ